jgi:hypothetical protein
VSYRKPFRAQPVNLSAYARARQRKKQRRSLAQLIGLGAVGGLAVFAGGMLTTNDVELPTYYPNCSAARAAGAAPISRGEPGYRSELDRDDDGVACEPYRGF